MTKVLLFGGTGSLGMEIAREAIRQGYETTVVVRNEGKAQQLSAITANRIVADVTSKMSLQGICNGFDVVISSLGKSVSPNDRSRPSFNDVDFLANSFILEEAKRSGVRKFVYTSAFGAETYRHLEYFRVHHDFSELLKGSGLDYSIIKPPALFSAFVDLIALAQKGRLVLFGKGDKKTNPIYEGDLAKICVASINEGNAEIEAGGRQVYTRKELNELIQGEVAPGKKVRSVPIVLVRMMLPLVRAFDRNLYDKLSFFLEVMQHDTIAPQVGETAFADYIRKKAGKETPAVRQGA